MATFWNYCIATGRHVVQISDEYLTAKLTERVCFAAQHGLFFLGLLYNCLSYFNTAKITFTSLASFVERKIDPQSVFPSVQYSACTCTLAVHLHACVQVVVIGDFLVAFRLSFKASPRT